MAQSASELTTGPAVIAPVEGVVARSPRQIFWARFKQDKLAIVGGILIVVIGLLAIAAPLFEGWVGHPYDHQYRGTGSEALMMNEFGTPLGPDVDNQFYFGADHLGRDLFVRVLYGARTSLMIAVFATGIEVVIGVVLGLFAGFFRGWVDTVVSRMVDLVLSIPALLLGIALSVALGGGLGMVIFIIAFFGWPYIARIVRGQVLSLREAQFVEASYSVGASSRWIMFREILPNLVAPIIIYATLVVPINILFEAGLSFLGVGVQEPTPAWGKMLAQAADFVTYGEAWWYMTFPGVALFLTVLGFNLLGDGLRDALDPKTAA